MMMTMMIAQKSQPLLVVLLFAAFFFFTPSRMALASELVPLGVIEVSMASASTSNPESFPIQVLSQTVQVCSLAIIIIVFGSDEHDYASICM